MEVKRHHERADPRLAAETLPTHQPRARQALQPRTRSHAQSSLIYQYSVSPRSLLASLALLSILPLSPRVTPHSPSHFLQLSALEAAPAHLPLYEIISVFRLRSSGSRVGRVNRLQLLAGRVRSPRGEQADCLEWLSTVLKQAPIMKQGKVRDIAVAVLSFRETFQSQLQLKRASLPPKKRQRA